MKKDALNTAIQLGQFIKLLNPLGVRNKVINKDLSRLRSRIDEQVLIAVTQVGTASCTRAQNRLSDLHAALLSSMQTYLDLPKLVSLSGPSTAVSAYQVAKTDASTGRPMAFRSRVESLLLEEALSIKVEPSRVTAPQEVRARVLHAYSSAVRNSSWLPTLLVLKVNLAAANTDGLRLQRQHGSHPGREGLQDNLLILCPSYVEDATPEKGAKRTRKPSVKAAGLYSVQVACSAEALLSHPDVAMLAHVAPTEGDVEPSLASLLAAATKPVVLKDGDTPEAVAQAVVDELTKGLMARKKAVDAAERKLRAKAEEAAKEAAIEALKKLDPKLRKLLKSNPDLLKEV